MGIQLRFWIGAAVLFVALLWLFKGILLPFLLGIAIAYFLDPVADRLEAIKMPRWAATSFVLFVFAVVVLGFLILLVPVIIGQLLDFATAIPGYLADIRERLTPVIERLATRLEISSSDDAREAIQKYAGSIIRWIGNIVGGVVAGGVALFDLLSLLVITPVVAFYCLRDWDQIVAKIDSWLPREHAETIRGIASTVDETLAGFVRGQATVCLMLGAGYAVALTLLGLDFGLVIGLMAGILSFIPYVGSISGLLASVGMALYQFDGLVMPVVIAVVFLIGQAIEGNYLTPKLVGDRVGLHPVWVIFALLAGGNLMGFTGLLLSVPVAAVIGVLVRFSVDRYLSSRIFSGQETAPDVPDDPSVPARTPEDREN